MITLICERQAEAKERKAFINGMFCGWVATIAIALLVLTW